MKWRSFAVADRLNVPRQSLNDRRREPRHDATSLILYGAGIAAIVGASFSLSHAFGPWHSSVVRSRRDGLAAGGLAVSGVECFKTRRWQGVISVVVRSSPYLPAYYIGAFGVLATVVAGIFISRSRPPCCFPMAREMLTGFWVTIVFLLNAFIFVEVGSVFRDYRSQLNAYRPASSFGGSAVAATCILARLVVDVRARATAGTNEPEHRWREGRLVSRFDPCLDRHARSASR